MLKVTVNNEETVIDTAKLRRGAKVKVLLHCYADVDYGASFSAYVEITPTRANWILRTLDTLRGFGRDLLSCEYYDHSPLWFDEPKGAYDDPVFTESRSEPVCLDAEQSERIEALAHETAIRVGSSSLILVPHEDKRFESVSWRVREKHCDHEVYSSSVSRKDLEVIAGKLYPAL